MDKHNDLQPVEMPTVIQEIKKVLDLARANVAHQVNSELLSTYWNVGRIIAEYEQRSPNRADCGKQTLRSLSCALTKEFGRGFSVSNPQFMRRFYQTYQIQQTASVAFPRGCQQRNCLGSGIKGE